MQNNNENIIESYIKEIKLFLPIHRKNEKLFLSDIKNAIDDYANSAESISRELLIENFGEPKEIALNYISEQNSETLCNTIKKSKQLKLYGLCIVLTIFIVGGIKIFSYYSAYKECKDAYIAREIINIEEEDEWKNYYLLLVL